MKTLKAVKVVMTALGRGLSWASRPVRRWVFALATDLRAALLERYPLKRRKAAWREALDAYDGAFQKFLLGIIVVLIGLDHVTDDVDAFAIGHKIVNLHWPTIGTIVLGAFVAAVLAAIRVWFKWAIVTGPKFGR